MKHYLQLVLLFLSPLILSASGDTLKTKSAPVKRWSITASAGYGLPFAREVISSTITINGNSSVTKQKKGTYGKGMFNFVSIGYKINRHLGSELGIHSTWGSKIMTGQITNLTYGSITEAFMRVSTNGVFAGFFITDTYDKFHVSLHNDLLIGIMNYATEERFLNGVKRSAWEYSGRISYGWLSRLGGSYDINKKMNIGISAFFLMHSWSPKQKNTLNGENKYTFTDDIVQNGIMQIHSDQLPRVTFPLHAAGVNLFIAYNF
jgi:hypothetical protein